MLDLPIYLIDRLGSWEVRSKPFCFRSANFRFRSPDRWIRPAWTRSLGISDKSSNRYHPEKLKDIKILDLGQSKQKNVDYFSILYAESIKYIST